MYSLSTDAMPPTTLGQALARVPVLFSLLPAPRFRVVVEGQQRELNSRLMDDIYRIGFEAIVNALRHSWANEIEVEIGYQHRELRVSIRDNGCGIDPSDLWLGQEHHRGFRGMRERADRIGARLRVFSRIAMGTEIELCIPARAAFAQA